MAYNSINWVPEKYLENPNVSEDGTKILANGIIIGSVPVFGTRLVLVRLRRRLTPGKLNNTLFSATGAGEITHDDTVAHCTSWRIDADADHRFCNQRDELPMPIGVNLHLVTLLPLPRNVDPKGTDVAVTAIKDLVSASYVRRYFTFLPDALHNLNLYR